MVAAAHFCPDSANSVGEALRPAPAFPLVTVIVRSMDRPELDSALASIARQDYPAIEIIVVDATGGGHRPLRVQPRCAGHSIRVVSTGVPLKRPRAADLGLASASGEWSTFLDDDDTCEPFHVSALVTAACANSSALVVYGRGRLFNADGALDREFGLPFNRALMHFGPLFYWQAALIRTRVRELGCRFDPDFEICEDRDFLAQIAEHGDFVFAPDLATFNYRPDLGTSGTGNAGNRDFARVARFENLLRAKWAGHGTYHNERAAVLCRQGVRAFFAEDLDAAGRAFADALARYPDDPNALHGSARVALAREDRALAERLVRAALAINPVAAEYRDTLAAICESAGSARHAPARLPSRTAACPCGSGLRYKSCCGRLNAAAPVAPAQARASEPLLGEAERLRNAGSVSAARRMLEPAAAAADASPAMLCTAAQFALECGDAAAAFPFLDRAAAMHCDAVVGRMLETCCARLADARCQASLWSTALRLRDEAHAGRAASPARRIRIVGANAEGSESARQAALLANVLAPFVDVRITAGMAFSAEEPERETCVVFLDADDVPEHGAGPVAPARIVIRLARDDPAALVRAFARLAGAAPGVSIDFTLPHAGAAGTATAGLPVEYPWINPSTLAMSPADPPPGRPLVVGRQGPGARGEDHPNDAMFYRRLEADGHRVVVPATDALRRALAAGVTVSRIELRDPGAMLDGIDVFLYRGDPNLSGYADARLLEAMAAARVPVVFARSLGAREWIVDGESGFVVGSEEDARACIARLAADRELLRRLGIAARASAAATMRQQRARALAFYLGVSLNE